jgi:hypothetical protein
MSGLSPHALPEGFPCQITEPKFALGTLVCWQPLPTQDFGTVTGLEYAPAEHLGTWGWRYIICLDPQSPSYAWTGTDTAWEDDLEPCFAEQAVTPQEVKQ